jgi:glc operon protein GlcG
MEDTNTQFVMRMVFQLPVLPYTQINQRRESAMSRKFVFVAISVVAALIIAGGSYAQQPNPLDTVPEKMPFDIPYGTAISLERADAVLTAAVAEAKKRDWKLICAVVDSGANLVSFKRMDGAQIASISIAQHKARASAKYRRETKIFESGIQLNNFNYVITLDDVIASRGGIPLVEGGKLIGAIGCSGGTGSQDEVVAKAGAALIK